MVEVQQYAVCDFELYADVGDENPFAMEVTATFTHELGEVVEDLPGFFDGDKWVVRFSPGVEGVWTGCSRSEHSDLDGAEWHVQCVGNENADVHGLVGIDPEYPQRFAWSDGTPFLYLGFECDWLFSYHQADAARCYRHVDLVASRGFSCFVMNLYAHTGFGSRPNDDTRQMLPEYLFGPPEMYLFEGANDAPDHERMNIDFFRDFDRLMRYLHGKGIVVHLMLQVQNKQVNWPARETEADDRFWRYAVARYQAFGNVIWDVGKESKNLFREMGDHEYVLERMDIIRKADAYGHLLTVHDVELRNAGTLSEPDRQSDFVTDQVHLSDAARYNREAIRRMRNSGTPYVNVEYGYELAEEQLKTYRGRTTAEWDDILKWTWAIYAAGAYPCYYYDNTSWDLIKFEPVPESWMRYRELRDFLEGLPFNQMVGDNEYVERGLCLALAGDAYLVYLPEGGDTRIDLSDVGEETPIAVDWMAILTGERSSGEMEKSDFWGGFNTDLINPFGDKDQPCVVGLWVGGKGAIQ